MRKLSLFSLLILFNGCNANNGNALIVKVGSSHDEVRTLAGKPERAKEFRMPETSFSGPQESLTGFVPAGTLVEEWVYEMDKEELYVWFTGQEDQSKDEWRVVASARYPVGAVY